MNGTPFAIATKSGAVVLRDTLDQYAVKRYNLESVEDPFNKKISHKNVPEALSKQAPEYNVYTIYNLVNPLYNPRMLLRYNKLNTYHDRCCRTKAVDIGGLGWHVTQLSKDENQTVTDNETVLNQFFQVSQPEETIKNGEYDKQQVGWGCLEIIREGGLCTGLPQRFEHIPSHTIRIHRNKRKFMQTWTGFKRTWFKAFGARNDNGEKFDVDVNTGEEHPFDSLPPEQQANELIYNTEYTPETLYYGAPVWISAMKTMIGDESAVDYNVVFFKNFGLPTYAVYITGNFQDEPEVDEDQYLSNGDPNPNYGQETGKTKMQTAMEAKFKEVINNPGSGMVFMIPQRGNKDTVPVTITFEKLSVDVKDASFRLYRQSNRDEIVTAHGVDPYRIGITAAGSLGGNTAIENKKSYKSSIAIPGQRRWESLINKIIWSEDGFNILTHKFELEEIDLEDETALIDSCVSLMQKGIMSPNDVIRQVKDKFGLEVSKDPAMDMHYIIGRAQCIEQPPATMEGGVPANVPVDVTKVLKDFKNSLLEAKKEYESSTPTNQ